MHGGITGATYKGLAVLGLLMLAAPWLAPNSFILNMVIQFLVNLLLIASLNLLMGYSGQISLAHAAFYGIGAYVSGVLAAKYGVSPWLGLVAALGITGATALLVGWPTLRLKGHYLAMATLGFNAIASVLFVELRDLTGGPNGLVNVPSYSLFGYSLAKDVPFYYFALAVTGACMLLMLNLLDSRTGARCARSREPRWALPAWASKCTGTS